ncbi:AMP-binding protein [Photobacterium sp.]|uniref:AMP-binding protein n=1 Tax=Photobacterium sp. TaxID=660 RepID=UPI00299E2DF8|nr:AMP-binding protein [Photobacterium sp.]MDX1300817.1 AMP-binding protein [Photobacterium sp.]
MNFQLNLQSLFFDSMKKNKESFVVYKIASRYSYDELKERVTRLSSSLTTIGVKKGDVVAIADWDSHRYLELYFFVPMIGATLMMCNISLSKENIEYTLNHS